MFTHRRSTNADHSRTQNGALGESEKNWSPAGMKNPLEQQIQYVRKEKKKNRSESNKALQADWCNLANTVSKVMLSDEKQNKKKYYHDENGPETTLI